MAEATLKRTLGLPLLTFYGVGTIVGGGFYALMGEVAGEAGTRAPVAFLAAACIAMLSAFSYAELAARLPLSAGEAHYVSEGFGSAWLSALVGWMVIATGVVSAATLGRAVAGFVRALAPALPAWTVVVTVVVGMGLVAAWGIGESAIVAAVITLIEVGGLAFVFVVASSRLPQSTADWGELLPGADAGAWWGVLSGAYIAFYSFVGFEDMVNVAEEVKSPERTLPRAIFLALGLTTLLYVAVGSVTLLTVAPEALAASSAPLSLAVEGVPGAASVLAAIAILAGVNGALVQIVMASRVAYGMAGKGSAPALFGRVHPTRRTPLLATGAATGVVLALALFFPLVGLARATSTILVAVYALVNLSLWRIKAFQPTPPPGAPRYPRWLPAAGCLACVAFLALQLLTLLGLAGVP